MATFADPFSEVAAVLAVAAAIDVLAFWLRQPLIIAFIFAGMLLGPAGLNWVHALDQVDLFAKLGIFKSGIPVGTGAGCCYTRWHTTSFGAARP